MTIQVITFDLDNTLWDVEPALLRAEEAQRQWLLENRRGAIDDIGHDELWALKKRLWKSHPELAHNVSGMRKLLLQELQRAAGYDSETSAAGADAAFAAFLHERQRVELYSDALEVLQSLAGRYRLGALTNGNADVYKTDAGEYFDFAFLAEEIGASKPAPDMFHAALDATGVRPEEVLHVGDNPEHDVRGAMAAGMRAAWINAETLEWDGDDAPDLILSHVRELPEKLSWLMDGEKAG
jgi:putative hydrolase of the HAD superfamily